MTSHFEKKSNEATSDYPLSELMKARHAFIESWSQAIQLDPVVRFVNDAHIRHPPNITVKNCAEYPFASNEVRPPSLTASSSKRSYPFSEASEIIHCIKPKRIKFWECFPLPTERVIDFDALSNVDIVDDSSILKFICDYCEFIGETKEEAIRHLENQRHVSCSTYSVYSEIEDDRNDDYPLYVLEAARNVNNPDSKTFGWHVNDKVTFCSECKIPYPDKITCSYHHFTQHGFHHNDYAYGTVLAVRQFIITPFSKPKCVHCHKEFNCYDSLTIHWLNSYRKCPSPFLPVINYDNQGKLLYCDQLLDVYNENFGYRLVKQFKFSSPPKHVFKVGVNERSLAEWVNGFGRFCINTVFAELRKLSPNFNILINIRLIDIDNLLINKLPSFTPKNESKLLLFCIRESELLIKHLESLRGYRRTLLKAATEHLNWLMELLNDSQSDQK